MSFSFFSRKISVRIGSILIALSLVLAGGVVYAAQHPPCYNGVTPPSPPGTHKDCYSADANHAQVSVVVENYTNGSQCVTNNNSLDIFIPTKTSGEWNAFYSYASHVTKQIWNGSTCGNPTYTGAGGGSSCAGGGQGGGGGANLAIRRAVAAAVQDVKTSYASYLTTQQESDMDQFLQDYYAQSDPTSFSETVDGYPMTASGSADPEDDVAGCGPNGGHGFNSDGNFSITITH